MSNEWYDFSNDESSASFTLKQEHVKNNLRWAYGARIKFDLVLLGFKIASVRKKYQTLVLLNRPKRIIVGHT